MTREEMLQLLESIKFCDVDEVKKIKAMNMAIAALKEQEEQSKGCDWCAGTKLGDIRSSVVRGNVTFYNMATRCPMCGRRLEKV